ncbi:MULTISPECIES: DUF4229 domain-containing protein [unclassified Modestobacter]|uniref:DUF4229 domain-containing protein n=1 Tax=unclassified Modestobacter TaxID=2643866 RepID=UPI0022A9FB98|nr:MULTISPECIES: DUF4229 domain-containing protein [unclassified Modestobacter]MCZ2823561.1 DUF4229 domain-containing protein [Modestobacter sp. VKM Ac-2981]MCZ2851806.1 DUF4229 domain-containing protein [Modestobacter sp. VKM Ac-2982]
MAEQTRTGGASVPGGTDEGTPSRGGVARWLAIYTLGRLAIAAALIGLLWVLGLPGTPGFLFGVLLAMPVSYLVLGGVRQQLTSALVARNARKEQLRAELRGSAADDG